MASGPIALMANRRGIGGSSDRFPLLGLQNHCGWWLQLWSEKMIISWQGSYNRPRKCVEKQRHYCADKGPNSQDYCLPIGHIWLWELDHEEGRTPKNWCLQTMVLENTPESPLDSKITPVNLKGNQPWILIGRSDAEAPEFWSSYTNSWLIGKVPDAGKDRAEEEGVRGWDGWMQSPVQWTWTWANLEMVSAKDDGRAEVHGVAKSRPWKN